MNKRGKQKIERALTSTQISNRVNSDKLMEKFPEEEIQKLLKKNKDGIQNTHKPGTASR